jgi:probable O-glycosylation ligase (exosortase A-associated)
MRDLLVVLIVAATALLALKRPYYGALLWVWIGLMNPHRMTWGFAYSLPLAYFAAIFTLLGMALNHKAVRWPGGGPLYMLLVLALWMGITTLFAILDQASLDRYLDLLKVIFMTFVIAMLVRTREEIIGLVIVIVASLGFYGFKGGVFTILSGGTHRVWGPPDSVVEGNNELAVALIMIVPLLYFLSLHARNILAGALSTDRWARRVKWLAIAAMALCAFAALGSQSRGALLAISAMLVVLWWRSPKKLSLTILFILLIPFLLLLMPESWYARMETINTYEQDASAMGRINAWTMAYNIALDRITGAGFATASPIIYFQYAPDPSTVLVAHSIYFQVLGEHGFIGLALYLLMWILTYAMAGRVVRLTSGIVELAWAASLASMVKVSFVGFAVGGAFLSLAYWDMPYYLLVVVVVLHAHVKTALAQSPSGKLLGGQG